MKTYSLSTMMEGLKANSGFKFVVLFAAFIGWLYVVYWIRHHEPVVNQVFGTTSQAPTATPVRSAIENTLPALFPPSAVNIHERQIVQVGPGQAISAPLSPSEQNLEYRFGAPISQSTFEPPFPENDNVSVGEPLITNYGSPISPLNAIAPSEPHKTIVER